MRLIGGVCVGLALVAWRPGWESVAVLAILVAAAAYVEWSTVGEDRNATLNRRISSLATQLSEADARTVALAAELQRLKGAVDAGLRDTKELRDRVDALSRPRKVPSI